MPGKIWDINEIESEDATINNEVPIPNEDREKESEIKEELNEFKDNEKHPIFTEMAELVFDDNNKTGVWKQIARWVKYEENVEKGGQRWSKPFVPTITLKSLTELRFLLLNRSLELNLPNKTLGGIWEFVVERWISGHLLDESKREVVLRILLSRHLHLYQGNAGPGSGAVATIKEDDQSASTITPPAPSTVAPPTARQRRVTRHENGEAVRSRLSASLQSEVRLRKTSEINPKKSNTSFMRKVPQGSEAFIVHVGEMSCLDAPISCFIRLTDGVMLGNLTEINLPTKFIFVILGPQGSLNELTQCGRAMSILMLNSGFKEIAYTVRNRQELLAGVDGYLDSTTVLPPPEGWDPGTRIEPQGLERKSSESEEDAHSDKVMYDSGLNRTGKFFGGLINDIKRKAPWYYSDFRDALSFQCIATWLFLYFACLTPLITFGGLLGEKTNGYMGTMETLLAGCLVGIVFALFSGQPLLILGATGPMLVFETILVDITKNFGDLELDYLELRLWVGIWIGIILLLLVALDGSAFVSYITKFTEENFATLIALIFIVEAITNLTSIADKDPDLNNPTTKRSVLDSMNSNNHQTNDKIETHPTNIFLLSILLFLGTFIIAFFVKEFRSSPFLPANLRAIISDFAVIIAILVMSGLDAFVGLSTPKLEVPSEFAPTIPTRGWLISPFKSNPIWVAFAALAPALLATILIFMDQQITAVIISRKSNKLKKGSGYHLDLFILGILIVVNSFLGLPWFVAATVESVTNLGSLRIESETSAPGEKPKFLGVREQRVTNLLVFITVGLSVFMTSILKFVPMPVLYGVFLYMGFSAIRKMELFERILLLFMPGKYQPDEEYLRRVPIRRVHLYTFIQVACLAALWVIKSISVTAIFFPIMLVVMMGVRKLLEFIFNQKELQVLDDLLPGSKKIEKEELIIKV